MISIHDLTKIYRNKYLEFAALKNISLTINQGEFVIIMGPSGCGKTTLLNILGCIDTFDSGSYSFDEKNVQIMNTAQLAQFRANNIGFIFQAYNLVNELNCLDNIELTMGYAGRKKKERRKRSEELI